MLAARLGNYSGRCGVPGVLTKALAKPVPFLVTDMLAAPRQTTGLGVGALWRATAPAWQSDDVDREHSAGPLAELWAGRARSLHGHGHPGQPDAAKGMIVAQTLTDQDADDPSQVAPMMARQFTRRSQRP